jgi:filamentous hemagglutinin family protein
VATIVISFLSSGVSANPIGPSGLQGIGGIQGLGTSEVTITQTAPRAILNWQQFNIAPGELTRFVQPSASSLALNRITDQNPSQIFGSLQANGSVILLNPNGVMFGPNAQVNVNGLIASSLAISDQDFLNGMYRFEGSALSGAVTNAGTIETGTGGFVYLLAPAVKNNGVIRTPEGHISLAAGTTAYLSDRPDGRGLLVEVAAPAGEALNLGELAADGGRVNLFGRVVNQAGLVRANTVREHNGRIELVASEQVNLTSGSLTEAKGDDEGVSDGGSVVILSDMSDGRTRFETGAVIDVSGGSSGGHGGFVELSGSAVNASGRVRAQAQTGYRGGRLLIDPYDLVVDTDFLSAYTGSGLSEILAEAEHDIAVTSPVWDFSAWELGAGDEGTFVLTAGNDIKFGDGQTSVFWLNLSEEGFGARWNIHASAGNDIILTGSRVWTGAGQGLSSEKGGDIVFEAGRDIKLLQGITHSALWAGTGSDLTLKAEGDLVAPSAMESALGLYSGIRLDGPGHLSITTGGDFLGGVVEGALVGPGFVLSQGTAKLEIGGDLGAVEGYANLTLGQAGVTVDADGNIQRGVTVDADGNIYLGLVQDKGLSEGGTTITIDPINRVSVTSTSGDVHLKPAATLRGDFDKLREYYPASFAASALQGSIFVESNLTFWPSLVGSVDFFARDHIQGLIKRDGFPTVLQLVAADPSTLMGPLTDSSTFRIKLNTPAQGVPDHEPAAVRFRTELGDIQTFYFDLYSPTLRKAVDISAGRDLKEFVAHISVPDGVPATVSAGRDIDMTKPSTVAGADSGLHFHGPGTGVVRAGQTLDLANSEGVTHRLLRYPSNTRNAGGLLDIAVGGNLEMIKSRIATHNGASITIHGLDGLESPVGGTVNVGTNAGSLGTDTGIITLRGGSIDITSVGNVEVNRSRVATFGRGDIRITSTAGNVNAGSGGRDEATKFVIEEEVKDADGNVIGKVFLSATVPGSGIFTFHPDDPNPLPRIPTTIDRPDLNRMRHEIEWQAFLGHDSPLLTRLRNEYNEIVDPLLKELVFDFVKDWQLGDVNLEAKESVVVPPAGIRGRIVNIKARDLRLEGGRIGGATNLDVGGISGCRTCIQYYVGNVGGAQQQSDTTIGLTMTLSGSTGTLATSTSSASTIAEEVDEKESTVAAVSKQASNAAAAVDGDEGKKGDKPVRSVRLKRGVTIEVQVSPEKL